MAYLFNNYEAELLDTNFETVGIIDTYQSFIWTDRYQSAGDFEIYIPTNAPIMSEVKIGRYLRFRYSKHIMIIEKIIYDQDHTNGFYAVVSGRSLECILDRRIVWSMTNVYGNVEDGFQKILNDNIINPSISERRIDNFRFIPSNDSTIQSYKNEAQYTGDNLYTICTGICSNFKIGYQILWTGQYLEFKFYRGSDFSYSNTQNNPYVVFSTDFENLVSSKYTSNHTNYKNVAHIGGEGEGSDRKWTDVGNATGIDRKEMYVNASDISSKNGNQQIDNNTYYNLLQTRGNEKISEAQATEIIEGSMQSLAQYTYMSDFNIGDKVQVIDDYGNTMSSTISEIIFSQSSKGQTVVPTFASL